ncbi:DNA internalization-related competence protein ComEC/Rec2 [Gynuella sunshinyii]|uniref:Putative hydrolase (Metallo-beta-lactamase superfamily) n=1 Tax=Gynuella sunshinyii YC6258 TaxID=1445510 RepID=A0A0C5VNF4_9GAMM|nr:DNA internalization-related competence protein ComEC/Rec2 [Gynuella sunshinyii]AJQ95836.1 putative hydrolase (metallo-beta-lactamase superfamily) [Gynuella sunshinyii YC6258]
MLYILLFWTSGILLGLFTVSFYWWLSFQIILCGILISTQFLKQKDIYLPSSFYICFFTFSLGVLVSSTAVQAGLRERVPASEAGQSIQLQIRVTAFPRKYDYYQSVTGKTLNLKYSKTLVFYWNDSDIKLLPGQRWAVTCMIKPPVSTLSPGAQDYRHVSFINHIDGQCSIKDARQISTVTGTWERLRVLVHERIYSMELAEPVRAFALAILTGDKVMFSPAQRVLFRNSQTQHLVVVSGLHLSMIFGMIYLISGWVLNGIGLVVRFPMLKFRLLLALGSAFVYAGICGFPVPTQRALIMMVIPALFFIFNRSQSWGLALGGAWIVVTAIDPLAILQPGTWLSFLAVTVLFCGLGFNHFLGGHWHARIMSFCTPQLLVFLGLSPLVMIISHSYNPFSVLVNLVAIPLVSFILLPLGFLMLLVSSWEPVFLYHLFSWGYTALQWVMQVGAVGVFSFTPSIVQLFCMSGMAVWLAGAKQLPGGGLLLCVCLVGMLVFQRQPDYPQHLQVTMLDVGQGQSIWVQRGIEGVLIDTGPGVSGGTGAYGRVVYPFLQSIDMTAPTSVVFSHDDSDHTSGLHMATETLQSLYWMTGEPDAIPFRGCRRGQTIVGQQLTISMLHPDDQFKYVGNNASCIVKIDTPDGCVLIPGDAGKDVEFRLVGLQREALRCDVLVAGHHGSRSSTSRQWLEAISPQLVLISAGAFNHFGHPHQQTLDNIEAEHIPWLSTRELSSVQITLNDHRLSYKPLKQPFFPWQGYINEIK